MNIFAKGKKQIILRREDLVKNTRLPSKELSKLFFGNTHFFEHYRFARLNPDYAVEIFLDKSRG
jgi:hypothetical protein